MSFRTFRHTLAGTVLTAALCLIGPSAADAAGPLEPLREGTFWEAAWQWLDRWAASLTEAPATESAPDTDAAYREVQDAGWTIDPDG
ncbi:MAG TPA: hypothetical protein VJ885_15700 [Thermoanaerobaculia bacterium]|nr:hypothetical protein [Thermoanaerobaculia bacterium]